MEGCPPQQAMLPQAEHEADLAATARQIAIAWRQRPHKRHPVACKVCGDQELDGLTRRRRERDDTSSVQRRPHDYQAVRLRRARQGTECHQHLPQDTTKSTINNMWKLNMRMSTLSMLETIRRNIA
jgi:hypothetical protein